MRTKPKTAHRIGPHGEKRPLSETASALHVMEIATGLREGRVYGRYEKEKSQEKEIGQ